MSSDSEPDFDDPRFLLPATDDSSISTQELTYAEKRRRTIGRGREKAQQQQGSRKQREEQAREQGLSRNLIAADTLGESTAGESKALRMMKQMGFQPGQGLGRKRSPPPPLASAAGTSAEPTSTATAGLGSRPQLRSPSPTPLTDQPPSQKPRTEPLKFELREKRTGLGIPSLKKPLYRPPSTSTTAPSPSLDLPTYLAIQKSSIDLRRAVGLFHSLRRTGEELDLRAGVEGNWMWRDEEAEVREEEKKRRRQRLEGVDGEEEEVGESRRGRGRGQKGGELAYEEGTSRTVVSTSDEEDSTSAPPPPPEEEAAAAFLSQPLPTRLLLAQAYLRDKYHYCQWCGVQYESLEDLEGNCPGLGEEEH